MRIGWAISGSYCNHAMIVREIEMFVKKGHDVTVILSKNSANLDTRFGTHTALIADLERITKRSVMTTIQDAETIGPVCPFDCMVIAPCTSTVISKLAHGDYDHTCTLAAKAMLRNSKPVVIAIASNDILGSTAEQLFRLKQTKNIYFVPFLQDDYLKKPNSCVSKWSLIEKTIEHALIHEQIQPLLFRSEQDYENFG